MSDRQSFYVGVKGIIKDKNGRVLILKDSARGKWEAPGGRIDVGQSIEGAFKREIAEEIEGASLYSFGELLMALQGDFVTENEHKLLLLFYSVKVSLPVKIKLSDEHEDFAWVDKNSLNDCLLFSTDRRAISLALNS